MYQIRTISFIKIALTIVCTIMLLLAAVPQQSDAASVPGLTVTVDYWGDQSDSNPGNGVCLTSGGKCTLRAAIEEINAYNVSSPGTHNIQFNWAGNPLNILPGSSLPTITAPVVIDGTTQTGSSCPSGINTPAVLNVILNGTAAGAGADGLTFGSGSDGSIVKGLVINNFDDNGIYFVDFGVDDVSIQCNHIGTNSAGTVAVPNQNGIHTYNNDNLLIGGSTFAARNVISGNEALGIRSSNTVTENSFVMGNFIGTDATGTTAVPNGQSGVALIGSNNQIGGAGSANRNVISGNAQNGISILTWSDNWTIVNNYIGVDVFGSAPLGNGHHGIDFDKGSSCCTPEGTIIGMAGQENVIANNGRAGIHVEGDPAGVYPYPNNNRFRYNSIYNNSGLGIDLSFASAGDGVTANDGLSDPDDGPNTLLNFPVLTNAFTDGVDVTVTFDYTGDAGTYAVDFYLNDSCDPTGYGEGQTYVHTDGFFTGSGNYSDTISFAAAGTAGNYLTSVATYGDSSSEFSACVMITDSTNFVINSDGDTSDFDTGDGRCDTDNNLNNTDLCTLRAAIEQANAFGSGVGPITVNFDIPGSDPHSIELGTVLPTITHPILLDATTQPGANCPVDETTPASIQVTINGGGAPMDGITLGTGSDGSDIRGFAFAKFDGDALQIDSNYNSVRCNHIGVDYTGTSPAFISGNGIHISGHDNIVGGVLGTSRNLISANDGHGLLLDSSANLNGIYGNIIGLDVSGMDPLGNGGSGIYINGSEYNLVGSQSESLGNIISANNAAGIFMNLDSNFNKVVGNKIGTDIEGNPNRGNGAQGIYGERADNNEIGTSFSGGVGNVVAGNGTYGIRFTNNSTSNQIRFNEVIENGNVAISIANSDDQLITNNKIKNNHGAGIAIIDGGGNATGNEISENSIDGNNGLGIDLEGDGAVEVNDNLDVDGGPNLRQNFPILNFVTGGNMIHGEYYSQANKDFTLEFFSNDSCDSSGYGEGNLFLGSKVVTTDGSGHVDFIASISGGVTNGEMITAVATDNLSKNSSEFSACLTVCDNSNPLQPTIDIVSNSVELGWELDPTALGYIIYRSVNEPYNVFSFYSAVNHPTNIWTDGDSDEIGDVDNNYYYAVAVDRVCGVSVASKTMGVFDFAIEPGTP